MLQPFNPTGPAPQEGGWGHSADTRVGRCENSDFSYPDRRHHTLLTARMD